MAAAKEAATAVRDGWEHQAHIPGVPSFWWWNAGATGGVRIRRSAFAPGTYPCCPPWIRYLAARRSEARCSGLYRSRCPCTSSRYTPPEYSIVCLGWRLTGQIARKLRGVSQFLQQGEAFGIHDISCVKRLLTKEQTRRSRRGEAGLLFSGQGKRAAFFCYQSRPWPRILPR
jgi:hypothetical protein